METKHEIYIKSNRIITILSIEKVKVSTAFWNAPYLYAVMNVNIDTIPIVKIIDITFFIALILFSCSLYI